MSDIKKPRLSKKRFETLHRTIECRTCGRSVQFIRQIRSEADRERVYAEVRADLEVLAKHTCYEEDK